MIVGTLGVVSAAPLAIGLVMIGLILSDIGLSGDDQWNLLIVLATWFVALPAAGLFALAGLATSITGMFRRPRALAGVGLGLSILTAVLAAAAVGFLSLLGSTYSAFEPLIE